jgi:hypothetical protein
LNAIGIDERELKELVGWRKRKFPLLVRSQVVSEVRGHARYDNSRSAGIHEQTEHFQNESDT